MGRILVTGATGFIGRRLTAALLKKGFQVRCLVRRPDAVVPMGAERASGDVLDSRSLAGPLRDVETAYYLVHSLAGGRAGFERRDREAVENFTSVADRAGVRRVIYLGGLGESGASLSDHLASRL